MSAFHESGDPAAMVADCAALNSDLDLNKGEGIKNDNGPRDCAAGATEDSTSALGGARGQHSMDSAGIASPFNAPSGACVTVFTAEDATLSKSIALGPRGNLVKAPAANMITGWARPTPAATAAALAAIINRCKSDQALCYALPKRISGDALRVVLKGRETGDAISRTKGYFTFSDGPGWCLFDTDGTGDADVFGVICSVVPGVAKAAHVRRQSTSHGLTDFIGREFPSSGGQHISPLLKKQSDTPRFLEALQRRLWLAGHGFITVGENGALYVKSPIDTSVKDVTKLVFEGPAILGAGLEQADRPAIPYEGGLLDSEAACPDLSAAEMVGFNRLVAQAKRAKKAEAEGARDAWEAPRIADLIAKGMAEKKARAEVRAAGAEGSYTPSSCSTSPISAP